MGNTCNPCFCRYWWEQSNSLRKKNEGGRLSLSNSKTYYKTAAIMAMPYWHKIRQINGTEQKGHRYSHE